MDDALAGRGGSRRRPYYEGPFAPIWDHWMRSFAMQARRCTCACCSGTDKHHVVGPAAFRGARLSVREASPGRRLFSTKGSVQWREEGRRVLTRRSSRASTCRGERVVKGVKFVGLRDVGEPAEMAVRFHETGKARTRSCSSTSPPHGRARDGSCAPHGGAAVRAASRSAAGCAPSRRRDRACCAGAEQGELQQRAGRSGPKPERARQSASGAPMRRRRASTPQASLG